MRRLTLTYDPYETEPMPYLVRVPDHIRIAGLDRDRWLLMLPAWGGRRAEAAAVVARHAAELFADEEYEIGRAYTPEVRMDLEQLAAREQPACIGMAPPLRITTMLDRDMLAEYEEDRAIELLAHRERESEYRADERTA